MSRMRANSVTLLITQSTRLRSVRIPFVFRESSSFHSILISSWSRCSCSRCCLAASPVFARSDSSSSRFDSHFRLSSLSDRLFMYGPLGLFAFRGLLEQPLAPQLLRHDDPHGGCGAAAAAPDGVLVKRV